MGLSAPRDLAHIDINRFYQTPLRSGRFALAAVKGDIQGLIGRYGRTRPGGVMRPWGLATG